MTQIKLEVGKKYRNSKGEVAEICKKEVHGGGFITFEDTKGFTYAQSGEMYFLNHSKIPDNLAEIPSLCLVEEVIEPAQEPVKKPHKYAELIKAWADGDEIQYKSHVNGGWEDFGTDQPDWDGSHEYRIKPEPKPDVVEVMYAFLDSKAEKGKRSRIINNHLRTVPNLKLTWDSEGNLKDAEVIA